jgi:hypothetical protein
MIAENAGGRIATASEVDIFDRQQRVGKPHRMRDFRKPCFAPANAIEGGMSRTRRQSLKLRNKTVVPVWTRALQRQGPSPRQMPRT